MSEQNDWVDRAVLNAIGSGAKTIREIPLGYRTVEASVKRLREAGVLDRRWDGNTGRQGRYVYFLKAPAFPLMKVESNG